MLKLHCIEKLVRENGSVVATLVATSDDPNITVSGNISVSTINNDCIEVACDYDLSLNKI